MTNTVAKIDPKPKAALVTGNPVAAMVPNSVESAWRLSEVIAASGMAPKTYGTDPNKIMVGMLAGMEIGLTPFAALQSIAVINGNPSLWGDGALALVLASNLVEDMEERDDGQTATCTITRVGRKTPIVRSFSNEDAKRAGLLGKAGPWTQYPARMRQMRARAFALRDGFPDVLKGLRIAEEAKDYQDFGPATAQPVNPVSMTKLTGAALLQQAGMPDAVVIDDAAPSRSPDSQPDPAATSEIPQHDAGPGAASSGRHKAEEWVNRAVAKLRTCELASDLEYALADIRDATAKLEKAYPDLWAEMQAEVDAMRAGFATQVYDDGGFDD
jgi:hypothetical protein